MYRPGKNVRHIHIMLLKCNVFIIISLTLINWIWYIKPNAYFLLSSGRHGSGGGGGTDKRAHHNALERKRRDHIKDSFSSLRDAIPTMQVSFDSDLLKFTITFQLISFLITLYISYFFQGDKSSRAQILKKASDYITFMRRKNQSHQQVSLFTNPWIICVLL